MQCRCYAARVKYPHGHPPTSMWCTGTSGNCCCLLNSRAFLTPTSRHKLKPGPTVTATASSCAAEMPACARAESTTRSIASLCAAWAMLGTTPPQGACSSACVARASPRTWPSLVSTATPVSSQLDSMPSTTKGLSPVAAVAAVGVLQTCLQLRTRRQRVEETCKHMRWALLPIHSAAAAWAMTMWQQQYWLSGRTGKGC
jgi:hypothetical protein